MKVVLKNVGKEPVITDLKKDIFNCICTHSVIEIDKFQGLYLYVEKNAEDKNFKIKHMDRCIKGDCFLVKMSKNGTFEDVTENELELMKNIVANNISEICKMLKQI